MANISTANSGHPDQDGEYTTFYMIDADGVSWTVRISTLGVITTELT